jgi:hypothetical protein
MYWFKRKYKQIQRVISFLPIIWRGYDWDYIYAINIFKHQLGRLADNMESETAWGLTSSDRASKIRTAIKLMDKVYDEEYGCEYQKQIELLYGKTTLDSVEIKDGTHKGLFTLKSTNELAVDEDHQKEINEVSHQMFLLSQDKQKKAHRILWKYIEHNIQSWWD